MEEDDSREFPLITQNWDQQSSSNPRRGPAPTPTQSPSDQTTLSDLQHSIDRFRDFILQIGPLSHTPIREDIVRYCSGQKKSEKCLEGSMRPEALCRKMELRIDKMLKTKKLKRNWGEQDLKILIWVTSKYADMKLMTDLQKQMGKEDWKFIASIIPGVSAQACMFKWLSLKKVTLATHNWTKEESQLLAQLVGQRLMVDQGGRGQIREWKQISQELYWRHDDPQKVYRNAKQCREHWTCYLSPQLKKGPWQLYEDVKLLKYIKDNKGFKKWSQIAKHFQGRTENALKNRYTLIIEKQKRLARNKNKTELTLIGEYLEKCYVDQFTVNVKQEPQQHNEQESSGYQSEESSCRNREQQTPVKRQEIQNWDTVQSVITPLRVQKFNINDFQSMSASFFRNIQPGVIDNGTFKKISTSKLPPPMVIPTYSVKRQEFSCGQLKTGPFNIVQLNK